MTLSLRSVKDLWGHLSHSHFTDEETGQEAPSDLSQVTQLFPHPPGIW